MSVRRPKRPLIIPIFIPNQGCPNRCIFCRQETITAQTHLDMDPRRIKHILNTAITSKKQPSQLESQSREVAFYGGTFTRLPIPKMIALLKAVHPYIVQGHFQTIRVSTRPDAIDEERLCLIKDLGVSTIELGVQSLDNDVLKASKRGYTAGDVMKSVQMLHKHAFRVGIQLMPGLPEDSYERFLNTVHSVSRIQPHMVRLYPAIVIKGTELELLYHAKKYRPLSLKEAIAICQDSCLYLEKNGIPVIRMGLMASPSLIAEGQIVAGPWHEAFGFLVRSSIHQKSIEPYLPQYGTIQQFGLRTPSREIPLVRGYKNQGLDIIEKKTGAKVLYVKADYAVSSGQVEIDQIKGISKIKKQSS